MGTPAQSAPSSKFDTVPEAISVRPGGNSRISSPIWRDHAANESAVMSKQLRSSSRSCNRRLTMARSSTSYAPRPATISRNDVRHAMAATRCQQFDWSQCRRIGETLRANARFRIRRRHRTAIAARSEKRSSNASHRRKSFAIGRNGRALEVIASAKEKPATLWGYWLYRNGRRGI